MSSKDNKDAEKFQHQLLELLKDEANKVCADCRARGPRWASWNLGVFICIRCAGLHRNLGVHIAKVKSVNLDTWTQEQVDNMLAWGNGVANEYYEYKLPSDFRRATDDAGVDKFVRNKYEKKLYIHENFDYANTIKNHPSSGVDGGGVMTKVKKTTSKVQPAAVNAPVTNIPVVPLKTKSDAYVPPKVPARITAPAAKPTPAAAHAPGPPSLLQVSLESTPAPAKSDLVDLFGDMVSAAPPPQPPSTSQPAPSENLLQSDKEEPKLSVKDSIMSLYGNISQTPQNTSQFGGMPNSQSGNPQFAGSMPAGMQTPGQFMGVMPQQQGAQFGGQQQQQFSNVQFRNGGTGMTQQFGPAQQNMVGMQQAQPFTPNQMFVGNQQFSQNNGQPQFNQLGQQGNNTFAMHNGMQHMNNMQGTSNMQNMQHFQGPNNMQGMNNIQGMGNMQGMNGNMPGMNQGMFMNNNMGGPPQQQVGYNMGQVNAANQQQHFDNIQRQLQQIKVGQTQQSQPQAGWAQAFGSG